MELDTNMKILFVIYDNESHISYFPMGVGYLAAYIKQQGFNDITIYNQDVYHYSEAHLTQFIKDHKFDVVGIGVIGGYYQYKKLLALSKAIKAAPNPPFFVIGGHGPSPEPAYYLLKTRADVAVIGEGEIVFTNLLRALVSGTSLSEIKGIAYREDNEVIVNPREELVEDIDKLPMPAWDLFPMEYYSLMRAPGVKPTERTFQVLTGRGCPFKCNFCYRMDPGCRPRSAESVIEELQILKRDYSITFFDFTDDLFMLSKKRTVDFCEKIIAADLNIRFICEGRLNHAVPEVLEIMKRAGCVFINYGIESLDEQALITMNKNLTVDQIVNGVENTIAAGLHPGLNIIWGNIGETPNSLEKGVEFLLKYNTMTQLRTIRPVTPYPGSPLYYEAIKRGLLKDVSDFYENKHLNSDLLAVNFTELSDDEFYVHLHRANKTIIEDYFARQRVNYLQTLHNLYVEHNLSFRGFRQT